MDQTRLAAVTSTGLGAHPDLAMDRLASLAARVLGAEASLVSLLVEDGELFPGLFGLPEPWARDRRAPLSQSLCRLVVDTADVVQIDDTESDPRPGVHGARDVLGIRSYLGVPLSDDGGNVLGSLCVLEMQPRRWTGEERQLLVDLGTGVSSELRARISASVAGAAMARIQLMADTSRALNSSVDVDLALAAVLEHVVPRLASWCVVAVRPVEDDQIPRVATRHQDPATDDVLSGVADDLLRAEPVDAVLSGDAPPQLLRLHRGAWPGPLEGLLGMDHPDDEVVVMPITTPRAPIGVWLLGPPSGAHTFADADIALVTDLGHRIGSVLRNLEMFERERSAALTLQRSLLPTLPDIDGVEIAGLYLPASTGAEVGGDWYDVIDDDDGVVHIVVGDVTGHSMDAAAAMGRLNGATRCYVIEGMGPAAVIRRLDRSRRHLLRSLLTSCVCISLRPAPDGWTASVCNAGHLPPIVVTPDGDAVTVELGRGPLIGLLPAPERTDAVISIEPGTLMVICTDGPIERRNESIDLGIERLRQAAGALSTDAPLSAACRELVKVLEPDGSDDIAVLCLSVGPSSPVRP